MSLYGSSKAAIKLLTKVWAAEYGLSGLRVNAVSPGPTRTEGTGAMGEALQQLAAHAPAGRPATADEIAEGIVFLATDRASFIHSVTLAVDGGRTAIWVLLPIHLVRLQRTKEQKDMPKLVIAVAIAVAVGQVVASQETEVMTPVRQFVDGFNKSDIKMAQAACADQTFIIDDFHLTSGADQELPQNGFMI
jgi:hypothetical protein